MSFKTIVYGQDNPSRMRRNILHVFYIFVGLFFWGLFSNFVPSSIWLKAGWITIIVFTVLTTLFTWWAYWTGMAKFAENASRRSKVVACLFLPLLIFMTSFMGIMYGAPSLLNKAIGDEIEITVNLAKEMGHSTRVCNYRLVGEFFDRAFPPFMCVEKNYFENRPSEIKVTLIGYKTKMGFLITSFRG